MSASRDAESAAEEERMMRKVLRHSVPQAGALLALLALTSCAAEPSRVEEVTQWAPPAPDTTVYFYPEQGRTVPAAQQDRDRYECNSWAVQQTGFDPSSPSVAPHQRVRVVSAQPSGAGVAVGGMTGALVGAATANPWHAGPNILIGALTGAAIGGIAESEHVAQINQAQSQADAQASHARNAALDEKAADYRRAMTACLEGRGYVVR
jgi:hypothetical protein